VSSMIFSPPAPPIPADGATNQGRTWPLLFDCSSFGLFVDRRHCPDGRQSNGGTGHSSRRAPPWLVGAIFCEWALARCGNEARRSARVSSRDAPTGSRSKGTYERWPRQSGGLLQRPGPARPSVHHRATAECVDEIRRAFSSGGAQGRSIDAGLSFAQAVSATDQCRRWRSNSSYYQLRVGAPPHAAAASARRLAAGRIRAARIWGPHTKTARPRLARRTRSPGRLRAARILGPHPHARTRPRLEARSVGRARDTVSAFANTTRMPKGAVGRVPRGTRGESVRDPRYRAVARELVPSMKSAAQPFHPLAGINRSPFVTRRMGNREDERPGQARQSLRSSTSGRILSPGHPRIRAGADVDVVVRTAYPWPDF